jgi:ketosteroid isomerase-like protein
VPESAEATVRALFAAFADRDAERALALVDPAFEFWPQGTAELTGREEAYRGHDGLRRYFSDVERVWDELRVDPHDLRVAGDGVVAFGTIEGRAGGQEVRRPVIWVFKLRDERLLYARAVATAAEALAIARTAGTP